MKKFALGGIMVATLLGGPVFAADAVYSWAGLYVGGNMGYSWDRPTTDENLGIANRAGGLTLTDLGTTSPIVDGVFGGLQAGYNWQMNSIVFGLEADIQASGEAGRSQLVNTIVDPLLCAAGANQPCPGGGNGTTVLTETLNYSQQLPWFGTVRGRIGIMPADRWLVFATGGLAYGEIQSSATINVPAALCMVPCVSIPASSAGGSFSHTKLGWVVGGGVERALTGRWTAKLEYLHIDLGGATDVFDGTALPSRFSGTYILNYRVTDDIVRVGLNYNFGH